MSDPLTWEEAADNAIRSVPWFVRKKAREAVERRVREEGRLLVTEADVSAVRTETMARVLGRGGPASVETASDAPPRSVRDGRAASGRSGGRPAPGSRVAEVEGEAIRAFVARAERDAGDASFRSTELEVRVCGAAAGCPMAVTDVLAARDALLAALDRADAAGVVRARARGPLLAHHRFKVSISGCPNACSQPQIVDFGLIGREAPALDHSRCIECGACVEACHEGALRLEDEGLEMFPELCVGCAACIRVCPVEALTPGEVGLRVLAGGRLGRHPQLAREVTADASVAQAAALLEGLIGLWSRCGLPEERVGAMLDRLCPDDPADLSHLLFQEVRA